MKSDITQIERIAEEFAFIARTLEKVDRASLLSDEVVQHGVSMALITIGEVDAGRWHPEYRCARLFAIEYGTDLASR